MELKKSQNAFKYFCIYVCPSIHALITVPARSKLASHFILSHTEVNSKTIGRRKTRDAFLAILLVSSY